MKKIAVFGSTRGSDLEAIISAIISGSIMAEISVVISNKSSAYILQRAKLHNIRAIFLEPKGKSREEYDNEILFLLEELKIDLVLLIGYMRYLSKPFIDKYRNRIINVHPSLLPAFAGGIDRDVHNQVLEYGVKITGCTVHFVDDGQDTGPIILQKAVNVKENDTVETLKTKVQKAEQEILPLAIKLFIAGKLRIEGRKVYIKT